MPDASSLNPQILPSAPIPRDEHRKNIVGGVTAAVIIIVIGIAYWWWSGTQQPAATVPVTTDLNAQARAEIAQVLAAARPATQEDVQNVTAELAKAKPATTAEKASVAVELRQSSSQEF